LTVKDITTEQQMQDFLDATGICLGFHALHESSRKNIGFLLGKSVTHTHWKELMERLSEHVQTHLRDMKAKATTTHASKKSPPLPESIPLQLTPTRVYIGGVEARALSIFVGASDKLRMERLLQDHPFPDIEIVADSWKRSNPDEYAARITIHKFLEDNGTTAIRITETSQEFREYLKDMRSTAIVSNLIIDIITEERDSSIGLIYVQCLAKNKPSVLQWVKDTLDNFNEDSPESQIQPTIAGAQSTSPKNSVRTFNTSGTKNTKTTFKSIIQAALSKYAALVQRHTPTTTITNRNIQKITRTVPNAFNLKVKSYAQILAAAEKNLHTTADNNSNGSKGSDNSTLETTSSSKTRREIELEQINETMTKETLVLQAKYNDLQATNTTLKLRLQQLEDEASTTKTRMQLMETQVNRLMARVLNPLTGAATNPLYTSQPKAPDPAPPHLPHDDNKSESKCKRNSPQKAPQKETRNIPNTPTVNISKMMGPIQICYHHHPTPPTHTSLAHQQSPVSDRSITDTVRSKGSAPLQC
jgi:hypothetical protein